MAEIKVKITDEILKGVYANLMSLVHTKDEFFLDFMSVVPSAGQGIVTARVITSPGHFKRMLRALQGNIQKYEKKFGTITELEEPSGKIGFTG